MYSVRSTERGSERCLCAGRWLATEAQAPDCRLTDKSELSTLDSVPLYEQQQLRSRTPNITNLAQADFVITVDLEIAATEAGRGQSPLWLIYQAPQNPPLQSACPAPLHQAFPSNLRLIVWLCPSRTNSHSTVVGPGWWPLACAVVAFRPTLCRSPSRTMYSSEVGCLQNPSNCLVPPG